MQLDDKNRSEEIRFRKVPPPKSSPTEVFFMQNDTATNALKDCLTDLTKVVRRDLISLGNEGKTSNTIIKEHYQRSGLGAHWFEYGNKKILIGFPYIPPEQQSKMAVPEIFRTILDIATMKLYENIKYNSPDWGRIEISQEEYKQLTKRSTANTSKQFAELGESFSILNQMRVVVIENDLEDPLQKEIANMPVFTLSKVKTENDKQIKGITLVFNDHFIKTLPDQSIKQRYSIFELSAIDAKIVTKLRSLYFQHRQNLTREQNGFHRIHVRKALEYIPNLNIKASRGRDLEITLTNHLKAVQTKDKTFQYDVPYLDELKKSGRTNINKELFLRSWLMFKFTDLEYKFVAYTPRKKTKTE